MLGIHYFCRVAANRFKLLLGEELHAFFIKYKEDRQVLVKKYYFNVLNP